MAQSGKAKEHMSGTVELNRLNELANYTAHFKKCHSESKLAQRAAKRLELAMGNSRITSADLDDHDDCGPMDWEGDPADGGEHLRPNVDTTSLFADMFQPTFELGSHEHKEWVAAAKATAAAKTESEP